MELTARGAIPARRTGKRQDFNAENTKEKRWRTEVRPLKTTRIENHKYF